MNFEIYFGMDILKMSNKNNFFCSSADLTLHSPVMLCKKVAKP